MKLREIPLLFLDTQTTGMRPPSGEIVEFGYFIATAEETPTAPSQRFALLRPGGLNCKISEITGIELEDLEHQPTAETWFQGEFTRWLRLQGEPMAAMIHCAPFETAFLSPFKILPKTVICTQTLVRRLFPDLPSRNIRAVSGYFGYPIHGPNRASSFVEATHAIWKGLIPKLEHHNVSDFKSLTEFLSSPEKPRLAKKSRPFLYRLPSRKRLNLPDAPGIYKLKSRDGRILYVGKATSLKDRVNSYFRGIKNRDKRKLEMIAQVWDLEFEPCASPLEAALLESDEIKRLDPPYNVSLKARDRELRFYSRDLLSSASVQSYQYPIGPFRPNNLIEMILALSRSLSGSDWEQIFFDPIDSKLLKEGWALLIKSQKWDYNVASPRSLLCLGIKLYRLNGDPDPGQDEEITAEAVAKKFLRLLTRAGGELARAKKLTQALNCEVEYSNGSTPLRLMFKHGQLNLPRQLKSDQQKFPWAELNIDTYDRMSVLLSELNRVHHRIVRHSSSS